LVPFRPSARRARPSTLSAELGPQPSPAQTGSSPP
jgi:hypothetical protein